MILRPKNELGKDALVSHSECKEPIISGTWAIKKSKIEGSMGHLADGACLWVTENVEPASREAIEAVGELWLEGPLVGRTYPIKHGQSEQVIFKDASSMLPRSTRWTGNSWRCYRAGELVRCRGDGKFVLIERDELTGRAERGFPCGEEDASEPADGDHSGESVENLQSSSESEGALETPVTEQGDSSDTLPLMLTLWAQVLQISPQSLAKDDDFFQLGGDATKAMRLSRVAHDRGLSFSVRDIYQNPCLFDLAALASPVSRTAPTEIRAFSLLGSCGGEDDMRAQVAQLCHVQKEQVVDLLPCSPLQEGMLALTQMQPGSYLVQQVYDIDDGISIQRLRRAWDQVVAMNPILRTRIVSLANQGLVQVVLEQGAQWGAGKDLDDYQTQQSADENQMGLGTPLSKFAIDAGPDRRPYFLWEVHHALYDGWSLPLLISEAENAYYNEGGKTWNPWQVSSSTSRIETRWLPRRSGKPNSRVFKSLISLWTRLQPWHRPKRPRT